MHTTSRWRLLMALTLLTVVSTVGVAGPARSAPPESGGGRFKSGVEAVAAVRARMPSHARAHGLSLLDLERELLHDETLHVDRNSDLVYVEPRVVGANPLAAAVSSDAARAAAPPTTGPEFQLESRPGADHTVYLDFDGHTATGTSWSAGSITTSPYDTDGDPNTWSQAELDVIAQSWAAVAEDFAPWDLNVTTKEPPARDLVYSGGADTRWGVRVVITPDDWDNCRCGGFAYVGSFDDRTDEPVYVFNSTLVGVAEASSHEVGHALGLAHDGLAGGTSYYLGHGSGEQSWAPIMGAGYYEAVTQWSKGDYYRANNNGSSANYGQGPDDLAIIGSLTNGNGFGLRPDDHGDDRTSSTSAASGTSLSGHGVIETASDVDAFSFTTGAGPIIIELDVSSPRPNLNIEAVLIDDSGTMISTASPTTLEASISTTVAAGTYHLLVSGVRTGSPLSPSPTGYVDYATIGQFTLSGTIIESLGEDTAPDPAFDPDPADGATDVSTLSQLRWSIVGEGTKSDVFLGTDQDTLAPLAFAVTGTSVEPGELDPGTTYYWRVDTRNDTGTTIGPLWSFTTGQDPSHPRVRVTKVQTRRISAPSGQRRGEAKVTVLDELDQPVGGLLVTGNFFGDLIEEGMSDDTNRRGVAVIESTVSAARPTIQFCVTDVTGGGFVLDLSGSTGICPSDAP